MAKELSMDQAFIKQLDAAIEAHLEDEQFGVEELASELGLSRSQLHRKLNAINGKSSSQYIREYRLEKAMDMLQNNVATASEIAYRVGFGSPTYFNTSFREFYGYPPGEVKIRTSLSNGDNEKVQSSNEDSKTFTIKRKFFNWRTYLIGALALILIVSFTYYNFAKPEPIETTENKTSNSVENSIAVLPFKNMSGNPNNEAFCDGMTTAIISRLSKIKGINRVISQTTMMSYKDNKKAMPEISSELNVHYILESSFQKSGDNIKINLQLIDGLNDKLFWSKEYEGQYDSIFKIQARVAEMVAKQLDADITDEERMEIQNAMTNNPEAYENYLLGEKIWSSWTNNSVEASRRFFEKAIALDSTFAEAYFAVGNTYSVLGIWNGTMTKMEADKLADPFYKKALQLDPNNPGFLRSISSNAFFGWNFKKADSINHILNDIGYKEECPGSFNYMMGNSDRIIENYFDILEDPSRDLDDPSIQWRGLPYALLNRGEIDEAKHLMELGLQLHPNYDAFYDHFGNAYLAMGDYEKAKDILETGLLIAGKRYVSMVVHLAAVYHYLGDEKKSLELLNEAIDRANKGEPEINVFVAHYYARLGNKDEAFKWLDIAYEKHEVDLIWLKADPNLLQLKDDPRYKKLVKKIGFLEIK